MEKLNNYIHDATVANFSAYTYDTVIVGGSGNTPITFNLNGSTIALQPTTLFNVRVASISASTANQVYLLGMKIDIAIGSQDLGITNLDRLSTQL